MLNPILSYFQTELILPDYNLVEITHKFLYVTILYPLSNSKNNSKWEKKMRYNSPLNLRPSLLQCKNGLIWEVTFLQGDSTVVFYYLSASEIWPDKRGGLWWEWPWKNRITALFIIHSLILSKFCDRSMILIYWHLLFNPRIFVFLMTTKIFDNCFFMTNSINFH
jgi:hypothetical protein